MSQKDIQDYLDKGMYGAPQIKPDEQKKYLGTFRERVVFIITSEESEKTKFDSFCLAQFSQYPEGTLLIDANTSMTIQNRFMKLAQQKTINFRMVDTEIEKLAPNDIALVFAVDTAIDLEDISVREKKKKRTPRAETPKKETAEKKGFFNRLFQ